MGLFPFQTRSTPEDWRHKSYDFVDQKQKNFVEIYRYIALIFNIFYFLTKNLDRLYSASGKGWRLQVKHFWSSRERNLVAELNKNQRQIFELCGIMVPKICGI